MEVALYEKSLLWSWSSFVIWLLAVATLVYGATLAAEEDKMWIYTRGRTVNECSKGGNGAGYYNDNDGDNDTVASAPSIRRVRHTRGGGGRSAPKTGGINERTGLLTEENTKSTTTKTGRRWLDWFDNDGSGSIGSAAASITPGGEDDDMLSVRSGTSEFFLRVKGHVIHAAEQIVEGGSHDDDGSLELDPFAAFGFILASSAFLLTLYYIDIFGYVSVIYLMAAAYTLHVIVFLPLFQHWKKSLHYVLYVYDWRNFPQDVVTVVRDELFAECYDSLRSSNLPLMQVDGEDAIYDEETGEVVTDSNLTHNSRFYLDPHLVRDIAERDERSRQERDLMRARGVDPIWSPLKRGSSSSSSDGSSVHSNEGSEGENYGAQVLCVPCSMLVSLDYSRFVLLVAAVCAAIVPLLWYFLPTSPLRWLWQDLMGISVVVFFLQTIRLPNLKVATALLCCAFVYDIFFVFISPILFGSSVMMNVATGGSIDSASPLASDENYCEKYPEYIDCAATTVPMLLYIPAFWTWNTNSNSILGLGDLVLPGLLCVWAARYDIRRYGSLYSEKAGNGYFPMVVAGYAFGLCLAQVAVEVFEVGQPALLYIVPCILLPILFRANRSETLPSLWEALPPMKNVGLPMNPDEHEKIIAEEGVVETSATWPGEDNSSNRRAIRGSNINGNNSMQAPEEDDYSVHSLHGYDLNNTRAVRSRDALGSFNK